MKPNRPFFLLLAFLAVYLSANSQTVTLLIPNSNDYCVPLSSTFAWTAPGAVRMNLQVSDSQTFDNLTINENNITSSTFTVVLPQYDVTYYWRVSATFTGGTINTSGARMLRTKPAPPQQSFPPDKESCVPLSTQLTWSNVVGTQEYWLQVATSATFTSPIYNNDLLTSTSTVLNLPGYYTDYFWRVKSKLASGCETDWSAPLSFKTLPLAPSLIAPDNNAKGVDLNATLRWGGGTSGALNYSLQVADNPQFNSPVVNELTLSSTSYTLNLDQYNKRYYWRVKANFTDCSTAWTAPRNFKTYYPAAVQSGPADQATCIALDAVFSWEQVPSALSYRLQAASSATFGTSTVLDVGNIATLGYTASLPAPLTQYFWRVRADDTSNVGLWSTIKSFTTTIKSPIIQSPPDSSGGYKLTVVLSWTQDYPNSFFDLLISEKPDMSTPIYSESNLATNSFVADLPDYNKTYYWQVRTHYLGCSSSWTAVKQFRTVIGIPDLVLPPDHSNRQQLSPKYSWGKVDGAASYDLIVASDQEFKNVVTGGKGLPGNEAILNELQPLTDYFWKVRAVNAEGSGDWSQVYTFKTNSRGPEIPQLLSPGNRTVKVLLDPVLSWKASARAQAYIIQVTTDESFSSEPDFERTNLANNSATITGLTNFTEYYWRVAAINDSGMTHWSEVWKFRTIAEAPTEAAVLLLPENNKVDVDIKTSLSWYTVARATGYSLQISQDKDFPAGNLYLDAPTVWGTTYYLDGLDISTKYFWRIQAFNEAGSGPWTIPFEFTTTNKVSVAESSRQGFSLNFNSQLDNIELTLTNADRNSCLVRLFNMSGQEVRRERIETDNSNSPTIYINASALPSGVYFCTVFSGTTTWGGNLLIVR